MITRRIFNEMHLCLQSVRTVRSENPFAKGNTSSCSVTNIVQCRRRAVNEYSTHSVVERVVCQLEIGGLGKSSSANKYKRQTIAKCYLFMRSTFEQFQFHFSVNCGKEQIEHFDFDA